MVTKRKAPRTVRRRAPARRAAPRRRAKSGITYIPSAMATAALVAVNAKPVMNAYNDLTYTGISFEAIKRRYKSDNGTRTAVKNVIGTQALIRDAIAIGGGYVAGEIVKKYAPGVIKRPLGKIAKKIPKVI